LKIIGVVIAMVVAMVVCGLLNMGIERVAYKPLRNAPRLAVLITAIGMSFVLQNVGLVWKGPAQVPFPDLISNTNLLPTESVVFRWKDLFVIVVTVPLLIVLSYFIQQTKQGKAMRAVAQDKEAAAMVGINVDRTISITFLLGGILAGASGVMYGLFNGITVFNVGFQQGLYAFTAAVLGGIGNLTGAVVGGFLIGIIGSMADQYIGVEWTAIVIFAVLILVLVFRPQGLLGDRSAVQGGGE
jgi:branched-chain amino acid transport system permease protein